MTTSPNPAVSGADTEQRITARLAGRHVANAMYDEALKMTDPAATLDNICDALPEVMPQVLGIVKTTPQNVEVLKAEITDTMWAYSAIEYARLDAGAGYGYVFDLLAENLQAGGDSQIARTTALAVPARLRANAEAAA